ncbi:MAG TPA: formate/nitrite transporter family protein [Holophagaceae bacterium]|nr:formate/nitrite transporter family protein [Holophagaceae bacterium]
MDPKTEVRMEMDPHTPAEMAAKVEAGGVAKAGLDAGRTLVLGLLAGAFIGLGGMFYTVAVTDTGLGFGPTRILGGAAFSLGLVLVVVSGAELFTGNNLIVIAWADRKITTLALLRNWALVYVGNFAGAVLTALGVHLSGIQAMAGGKVAQTALAIATAKAGLAWGPAFVRGVFCNALVCLAVWMGFSARTTTDKVLCVLLPVTAFVATGMEHSIANMYFLPVGLFVQGGAGGPLSWGGSLAGNLVPVTLGNILGGGAMVGLVYWFIYLRRRRGA